MAKKQVTNQEGLKKTAIVCLLFLRNNNPHQEIAAFSVKHGKQQPLTMIFASKQKVGFAIKRRRELLLRQLLTAPTGQLNFRFGR